MNEKYLDCVKESGTECSHVCSFAVFSRVVIGSVQL